MMIMRTIAFFGVLAFVGCASSQGTPSKPSATKRVIDQTPGKTEIPAWVVGGNRFDVGQDKVGFKGVMTMDASARPDACTHAAGIDAKGKISSLITTSVLEEAGISGDQNTVVAERMVATLSKQKFVGVEIMDDFWTLIELDTGDTKTKRLECWAQVVIPKDHLRRALDKAAADLFSDPAVREHKAKIEKGLEELKK